eukprot:788857_1
MMKCHSARFVKLTRFNSTAVNCTWTAEEHHHFKVFLVADKLFTKSKKIDEDKNVWARTKIFQLGSEAKHVKCGMFAMDGDKRYATGHLVMSNPIKPSAKVERVTLIPIRFNEIACSWNELASANKYRVQLHYGIQHTLSKVILRGGPTKATFVLKKGSFPSGEKYHCTVRAFGAKSFAISQPGLSRPKVIERYTDRTEPK